MLRTCFQITLLRVQQFSRKSFLGLVNEESHYSNGQKLKIKLKVNYLKVKQASERATVSAQTLTSARDVSLIGTHMSHTLETQQEYYRANRGAVHAAESFTLMEGLRMGSTCRQPATSPPKASISSPKASPQKQAPESPTRRVPFSDKEVAVIKSYFGKHIEEGRTPTLKECRDFLSEERMNRAAKSIQDKVRNLI